MSKAEAPLIGGRDAAFTVGGGVPGALGFARPMTVVNRPGANSQAAGNASAAAAAAATASTWAPTTMVVEDYGSAVAARRATELDAKAAAAPPPIDPFAAPAAPEAPSTAALLAAMQREAAMPSAEEIATLNPAQFARRVRRAKRAQRKAKRLARQHKRELEAAAAAKGGPIPVEPEAVAAADTAAASSSAAVSKHARAQQQLAELAAEEEVLAANTQANAGNATAILSAVSPGGSVATSASTSALGGGGGGRSNGIEVVALKDHPDALEDAIPNLIRVEAGDSDDTGGFGSSALLYVTTPLPAVNVAGIVTPVLDAQGNPVAVGSPAAPPVVSAASGVGKRVDAISTVGKRVLDLRALTIESVLASNILRPLFHVFCGKKEAEENLFFLADANAFLKRLEETQKFAKDLAGSNSGSGSGSAKASAEASASAAASLLTPRRGAEGAPLLASADKKDDKQPAVNPNDTVEALRRLQRPSYFAARSGPEWKMADALVHDYFGEHSAFSIQLAAEYKQKVRDEYADIAGDPLRGIEHVPKLLLEARAEVSRLMSTGYLGDFIAELERQVVAHSIPVDMSAASESEQGAMLRDDISPSGIGGTKKGGGLVPTINPAVVGDRKIVIILGGGFCGSTVAGFLDKLNTQFYVVMIDTKPFFEYTPSMPKVFLDPTYHNKIIVPHTSYVRNGKVIVGEVRAVRKDCVIVGLEELRYDFLVVATGSHYPSNIKGTSVTASYRGKQLLMERKRLDACKSVVVIGGGVVGVEMSFEIKSVLPHVDVTVVHSQDRFLVRLPQTAHDTVKKEYDRLGVKYLLKERVVKFDDKQDAYVTDKGNVLHADRAYWCGGPSPLTAFMEAEFGDRLGDMGHIRVDEHLLMVGSHNVFSGGDCCSTKEEKLAFRAEVHGKVIAYNIVAANNGSLMQSYECPDGPDSQVISMGKVNGLMVYNNQPMFGPYVFVKDQLERVEIEDRVNNGDDVGCCNRTGLYCSLLPYFCGCK